MVEVSALWVFLHPFLVRRGGSPQTSVRMVVFVLLQGEGAATTLGRASVNVSRFAVLDFRMSTLCKRTVEHSAKMASL